MQTDEFYMERCIQLAQLGRGNVAPNPLVGAVIVHEGEIIGEGYHQRYGGPHAEVNAVASVNDTALLKNSTIYVSLEPCAHHGKTPPCADLIVQHQFKRVVVGALDANSLVDGKGIERIRNAGIEVTTGVLSDTCRALNKRFFTFHEKQRPYVLLKWAQSPDGFIDAGKRDGQVTWISAPEVQPLVHTWRSEQHAILVGRTTIQHDNPSLTVRAVAGNNPIRVVIDPSNALDEQLYHIHDGTIETIILNSQRKEEKKNLRYVKIEDFSVSSILDQLHKLGIQSVLIEGGRTTLQSFIDANLWDEAHVIIGQQALSDGTPAPSFDAHPDREERFFGDLIKTYHNA